MVLESLFNPQKAEKEPWELFFVGFLYASIGLIMAFLSFGGEQTSILMVSFTAMACTILMYNTLKFEAEKDIEYTSEKSMLKHHKKALSFFLFLFFGFTVAFCTWFLVLNYLSSDYNLAEKVFSYQLKTINSLTSAVTTTGSFYSISLFKDIFMNNLLVLVFSLIFSLFYGFGAIFLLTWNASILGVALATTIQGFLNATLSQLGVISTHHYFSSVLKAMLRYLIHGLPEILAYFMGGLAGGIISIGLIKSDKKYFIKILKDATILILLSILILIISAVIEVYIILSLF